MNTIFSKKNLLRTAIACLLAATFITVFGLAYQNQPVEDPEQFAEKFAPTAESTIDPLFIAAVQHSEQPTNLIPTTKTRPQPIENCIGRPACTGISWSDNFIHSQYGQAYHHLNFFVGQNNLWVHKLASDYNLVGWREVFQWSDRSEYVAVVGVISNGNEIIVFAKDGTEITRVTTDQNVEEVLFLSVNDSVVKMSYSIGQQTCIVDGSVTYTLCQGQ